MSAPVGVSVGVGVGGGGGGDEKNSSTQSRRLRARARASGEPAACLCFRGGLAQRAHGPFIGAQHRAAEGASGAAEINLVTRLIDRHLGPGVGGKQARAAVMGRRASSFAHAPLLCAGAPL